MAFQTGTALHIDDLLSKLSIFAQIDGWTENKLVAGSGDGHSSELYLESGECNVQFGASVTSGNNQYHGLNQAKDKPWLRMYGATGFDNGAAIASQPNSSGLYTETDWLLPNMTSYTFFSDGLGTYIHVVIETVPGEWRHFGFGVMSKIGAFDGGMYIYGTTHDQGITQIDNPQHSDHRFPFDYLQKSATSQGSDQVRVNVDGDMWKQYRSSAAAPGAAIGIYRAAALLDTFLSNTLSFLSSTPNTFNALSPMFQIPVIILRGSNHAIVGHILDIRLMNIKNVSPGATQVLGSDTWHMYPVGTKGNPAEDTNLPNSGYYGIAFKEIA